MWPQTGDVIPAKGFKLLCGRNTKDCNKRQPRRRHSEQCNDQNIDKSPLCTCLLRKETLLACVLDLKDSPNVLLNQQENVLPFTDTSLKMPHSQRNKIHEIHKQR